MKAKNPRNPHGIPQAYFFTIPVVYSEKKIVGEFLHVLIYVYKITTEQSMVLERLLGSFYKYETVLNFLQL